MNMNETAFGILQAKGLTEEEIRNVDLRVLAALAERNSLMLQANEQYNKMLETRLQEEEQSRYEHSGPPLSWSVDDDDDDSSVMVSRPAHHTSGKVECIDAIESATEGLQGIEAVCTGNVIKYAWRWKLKNGVEDLLKARWYLDKLIAKQNS